jgi:hypothetical protein
MSPSMTFPQVRGEPEAARLVADYRMSSRMAWISFLRTVYSPSLAADSLVRCSASWRHSPFVHAADAPQDALLTRACLQEAAAAARVV